MKNNKILKIACYIAIPILFAVIIFTILYMANSEEYKQVKGVKYFESEEFAEDVIENVKNNINSTIYATKSSYTIGEGEDVVRVCFGSSGKLSNVKDYKYLIIYEPTNKVYTNIQKENYSLNAMQDYINNLDGEKITISNGDLETSSEVINKTYRNYDEKYFSGYYYKVDGKESKVQPTNSSSMGIAVSNAIIEAEDTRVEYNIKDFDIYMTYKDEYITNDDFITRVGITLVKYENILYVLFPICVVLLIFAVVYLEKNIGYKGDKKEVELNDLDKIPTEILITSLFAIIYILYFLLRYVGIGFWYNRITISSVSILLTVYLSLYGIIAISISSIIRRIKAKVFWKNTIVYRIYKLMEKVVDKTNKWSVQYWENKNEILRVTLYAVSYLTVMFLVFVWFVSVSEPELGIIGDFLITVYVFFLILKRVNNFNKIKKQLKKIYEGNTDEKLNEDEFTNEFKQVVKYINDISNGFERAVQEGVKSERLKTELITNVSHDIKTPLTSIINYVDLIKRENIKNEKVKEYIKVLEAKSNRLKRLTEDLVEASKASSGNVKLNLEKLNFGELINQTTGEFEDKFKQKKLELITNMPKEDIYIEADSRYMYRIIENVFSNVAKYALKGSRVYIDVIKNENKVITSIKNISAEKLNISEEELMQRFVRGDKSRTTEGSGLGLSISKSLAELLHGSFNIHIDGDLFKVELEFEIKS